jgi:hypothetical protein
MKTVSLQDLEVVHYLTKLAKRKYYSYRVGARKRNLAFDLTFNQFREIITESCRYCGFIPVFNKDTKESSVNGIDRVDNAKGYHMTNVAACCSNCNYMKSNLTEFDFLKQVSKIYHNLEFYKVFNPDQKASVREGELE